MYMGFPRGSGSTESACSAGDPGSIPESGRSPGEGNDYPIQFPCLENSTDRGAWWTYGTRGHRESDTAKQVTPSPSSVCVVPL